MSTNINIQSKIYPNNTNLPSKRKTQKQSENTSLNAKNIVKISKTLELPVTNA